MWPWHKKKEPPEEEAFAPHFDEQPALEVVPEECPKCLEFPSLVNKKVAEYRGLIQHRIDDAKQISDKETLLIGDCVNNIVSHTRQYIDESRSVLEENFSGQAESLDNYLGLAKQSIATQTETIEKALTLSDDITQTGAAVDRLAGDAKLLAINATIEAARLGSDGNAFGVISDQMNRMSNEIATANKLIADSSEAIKDCLPAIVNQGKVQVEKLEEFTETMRQLKTTAEESMSTSSDVGNTHLDMILDLAYSALSHLQFQDPMIQSLQKIDHLMQDLRGDLNENLGVTPPEDDAPPMVKKTLGELIEDGEPGAEAESRRDAGDVLLF